MYICICIYMTLVTYALSSEDVVKEGEEVQHHAFFDFALDGCESVQSPCRSFPTKRSTCSIYRIGDRASPEGRREHGAVCLSKTESRAHSQPDTNKVIITSTKQVQLRFCYFFY
jgi:hypothetical protein